VTTGLVIWVSLFFLRQTNLAASDLGRHIKNGEIIVTTDQVFQNNLYSYTTPDFHAPNHHWLFGVIVYLIQAAAGFNGLTLMGALLYTGAVAIAWKVAVKKGSLVSAAIAVLMLLPLLADRTETRPEAFSVFFFMLLYWLFDQLLSEPVKLKRLWWLVGLATLVMVAWINIHIFFVLAGVLGGAAVIQAVVNKQWLALKAIALVGLGMITGVWVNPLGLELILYPLQIFSNYGYRVAENQGLWFFLFHFTRPIHWYVLIVAVACLPLIGYYLWKNWKSSLYQLLVALVFLGFIFKLIRMENVLALTLIPLVAASLDFIWQRHHQLFARLLKKTWVLSLASLGGFGLVAVLLYSRLMLPFTPDFGVGLLPGYDTSIQAVRSLPLNGPIFNNFDSGSFLIYSLYPNSKVFIDNRAEAYPSDFVQNTYIAAQEDETIWENVNQDYGFHFIIYYYHDMTNWGQEFLVKRYQDTRWVPIYVDPYILIFAKDMPENQELIEKYRLPEGLFSVSRP